STLLLSFLLMAGWTLIVSRLLTRLVGPHDSPFFLNGISALTFAYLDTYFRTHEPYSDAVQRAAGLQIIILLICFLPQIIALPLRLQTLALPIYFKLRLRYLKWRLERMRDD